MSASNSQLLPPKMALQFAERAKRGEADNHLGCDIFEFFQGNQIVCLIGLENPTGHIRKVSGAEMAQKRNEAKKTTP